MLPAQIMEYYNPSGPPPPPPPPMIPSAQTAFVSPLQMPTQPPFPASAGPSYAGPTHPPSGGLVVTAPPPPGPPPPPPGPPGAGSSLSPSPMHGPPGAEAKRPEAAQPPVSDARSDLLAAIRMGECASRDAAPCPGGCSLVCFQGPPLPQRAGRRGLKEPCLVFFFVNSGYIFFSVQSKLSDKALNSGKLYLSRDG